MTILVSGYIVATTRESLYPFTLQNLHELQKTCEGALIFNAINEAGDSIGKLLDTRVLDDYLEVDFELKEAIPTGSYMVPGYFINDNGSVECSRMIVTSAPMDRSLKQIEL